MKTSDINENNKNGGFTLIELMVVISILALLSSIVLTSLESARIKARDARRMSDIQQINNAIQLYIAEKGYAPPLNCEFGQPDAYECSANETNQTDRWNILQNQLSKYISTLPKDPCGVRCYDSELGQDGYYGYSYLSPALLFTFADSVSNNSINRSSYRINAHKFEGREGGFYFRNFEPFNSF